MRGEKNELGIILSSSSLLCFAVLSLQKIALWLLVIGVSMRPMLLIHKQFHWVSAGVQQEAVVKQTLKNVVLVGPIDACYIKINNILVKVLFSLSILSSARHLTLALVHSVVL